MLSRRARAEDMEQAFKSQMVRAAAPERILLRPMTPDRRGRSNRTIPTYLFLSKFQKSAEFFFKFRRLYHQNFIKISQKNGKIQ